METITEKTTVKGKPEKVTVAKPSYTVTEKIVLRRASFRFLLAILILGIYAFTIYSFDVHITNPRSEYEYASCKYDRSADGVNFADRIVYVW